LTAPCTVARTLRDGDVVTHRAVVRVGDGWMCLDCKREWPPKAAKVEK
jgi:hypothetical protein